MNNTENIKIVHCSDLHFNPLSRIPQSRTDSFHEDIKSKWDWLCGFMAEQNIKIGLISGDIFHLKRSSEYHPRDINYYTRLIQSSGAMWYSIPGNHDLPASAYDNKDHSAYQTLCNATSNLNDISWSAVSFGEGESIVNVIGIPYLKLKQTMEALPGINEGLSKYQGIKIVLLHIDALPDPGDFTMWDIVKYDQILDLVPNGDIFCLGHIHQGYDVYSRAQGERTQLVSKPWSFSRVVKDYYNKTDIIEYRHKPSVAVINICRDTIGCSVQIDYHEIPHRSFESAFQRESIQRQLENSAKVRSFIEDLKQSYGDAHKAFDIADPNLTLAGMEISSTVRDIINQYLEA